MNEPLTNSLPGVSFSGKSYNKHPQWYNQPLRLTKEQKQDPLLVLDDFFECYHLNEVRETFWEWLSEVVSSTRSISSESNDRSNHFYFYEKIEGVIEAAFIIKKRMHKYRRKKEKKRLKVSNQTSQNLPDDTKENTNSTLPEPGDIKVENGEILNKPRQLIEYVDDDPLFVISEVFNSDRLAFICNELRAWFDLAMSSDNFIYEDAEQRKQLLLFHDQLQMLVEALFVILTNYKNEDIKALDEANKPRLLSQNQIADPLPVIIAFLEKFPGLYITRELNDWLYAGICYPSPRPNEMSEANVLDLFRNISCLIKSAERLLNPQ